MKPFTVPGLLRAAASYIEIHGHEQRSEMHGGIWKLTGPSCPIAAFERITFVGGHEIRTGACGAMRRYADILDIARWSDRTPTAEVLATMRRVARELDAQ